MTDTTAMALGALGGALAATGVAGLLARRARAALVGRIVAHVRPVLERRANALGVSATAGPRVDVGGDGELRLQGHDDELTTLLRLADSIERHEQGQVGFLDTIRIAREDVAAR